jgi:hypothetical protein
VDSLHDEFSYTELHELISNVFIDALDSHVDHDEDDDMMVMMSILGEIEKEEHVLNFKVQYRKG